MKTAFLYAGQGSQVKGMGKDLYEAFPAFRKAYDEAELDFDVKTLSFEDPEGKINETRYTQPALVAFACGMTAVLRENGILPDYALGLSLGEYSALEAASVFSAKTAVEMVAFRGKKMEEASKGIESSMAAILGMSEEALDKVCKEVGGAVSLCNLNCPGQIVIGGENISFREGTCPVLHNFLGRERQEGDLSVPELLVEQVQKPVRMEEDLRRLLELGVRNFVEIGPGKTISGFLKKTAKDMGIEDFEVVSLENKEELEAFLESKNA